MTWPDEATVERVKDALFIEFHRTGQLGDMARAALSVLPDPTADTVLLDQVREIAAEWDDRGATWCMTRIAALLAEADQ